MTADEILKAYFKAYETPCAFDPKHPEDGTLSRKDDGLPVLPMNAEETQAACMLAPTDARALDLVLNNVSSGTNPAAEIKADFLGRVARGEIAVQGLTASDAIRHLGYMKGGHNVAVLIGLLDDEKTAGEAVETLSDLVLIHNAFDTVVEKYGAGNKHAAALLDSWARADWFTHRKPVEEQTQVVVYKIPDSIEASTDFLSHSKGGHTRTDIPKHGKHYFMNAEMLAELNALKQAHPDIPAALAADKIGTSSSRKSGMNNVEWNTGIENGDTRFQPDKRTRAIVFAGSVLGPIFAKTAQDMGSVVIRTNTSVLNTGDVVTIVWRAGEIRNEAGDVIAEFAEPVDLDILRAGGGTLFRMGRILTANASAALGKTYPLPYKTEKSDLTPAPMTAAQKVIALAAGLPVVRAGQTVYARVDTVASQDTTGPMTVQELQGTLAATKLAVPLFLQSQCHNAAMGFRTPAVIGANSRLADFVKSLGGVALNMGDGIIHSWLNELVVPNTVVVGGDSHTRTPTALSFPLGSGGIAEAAATGVCEIKVPHSVLVVIEGEFKDGITVRDLVNYLPYKAQKLFGKNVFEGAIIEYRRLGLPFGMIDVFKLTNSSAERSAAAAYFEQNADDVAHYLKQSSIPVVETLIKGGYDNGGALARRLETLKAWTENPQGFAADKGASYAAEIHIDLAEIDQPYIACPHTPDNVKPLSELAGTKADFCFVGSCMSGERDFERFEQIVHDKTLACEVWAAVPTRLIQARLENREILRALREKGVRVEVSGCSLCMGNQERVKGEKNVLTTSTRNFKGRMGDAASVWLVSAELEAAAAVEGAFPSVESYFKAVKND